MKEFSVLTICKLLNVYHVEKPWNLAFSNIVGLSVESMRKSHI